MTEDQRDMQTTTRPTFLVEFYTETSEGPLWCIVDAKTDRRVDWSEERGWNMRFSDKAEAQRVAESLVL